MSSGPKSEKRVLVLGASGMLGNTVLRYFLKTRAYPTIGSVRSETALRGVNNELKGNIITGVEVTNPDDLTRAFAQVRPHVVINCVGVVKQLASAEDPLIVIPLNAILPHRLAQLCAIRNARLIHISTDCVFSGSRGRYRENDPADATDLYGRSKYLGEVSLPHTITLRTSIIGHERGTAHGLVEWFLAQTGSVSGYSKAIFSGFPTVELARIIHDFVIPSEDLSGVYHVAASPIDKCSLLREIASVYGKTTVINSSDQLIVDRSLDATRFRQVTGYDPPSWPELVRSMHAFG